MPVPCDRAHNLLTNSQHGHLSASQRIPAIARPFVSDRAARTLDIVEKFVEEECIPADAVYLRQLGETIHQRFTSRPSVVEDLKRRAKELGVWNMFLPKAHFEEGAGFSNLEYGLMAELLGKSRTASEACNCAAPDTGNMEVLAKYGNEEQKRKWLTPLLAGEIRSAFLMTEPQVASSDATNIELTIKPDGDSYLLNGQKWWSSGIGDPRCKILVVLGKTDAANPNRYKQQSVILVPIDSPGITIHRMLSVFGYDDAPHGHGHVTLENVRVPATNMILGQGRGFEIIQGRLGPGRIHHAMRSIGAAEKALEWFLARVSDERRKPFGQLLNKHGIMLERLARSRIEIDAARLAVLNAAIQIDETSAKGALKEIAEVKVLVPAVNLKVIDWAIQAYGGAGVSQETPLASMYANGRTMRMVDGPDEVHLLQLGKKESERGPALQTRLEAQRAKGRELCKKYGIEPRDPLHLNRTGAEAAKL